MKETKRRDESQGKRDTVELNAEDAAGKQREIDRRQLKQRAGVKWSK
jgi:hypothetical protein